MFKRTRKPNHLSLGCEKLEERVLFSLSGLENVAQLIDATVVEQSFEQSIGPKITSITSTSSTEITLRYTTLKVAAQTAVKDGQLSYEWSVISAPPDGSASYLAQGYQHQTGVVFSKAGQYTLRATVSDAAGGKTSQDITLNVIPTPSKLRVFTTEGVWVSPTSSYRVEGSNPKVQAIVLDQFGNPMPDQEAVAWTITDSPAGSTVRIANDGHLASFDFDKIGWHTAEARVNGRATSVRFEVRSVSAPVPASGLEQELPTRSELPQEGPNSVVTNGSVELDLTVQNSQPQSVVDTARIINVSTAAELVQALKIATGGEEILLAGGVNFGMLKLYKPANIYSSEVVVRSADAMNRATFDSVVLTGVENLTISNVRIVTENRYAAIAISDSRNIQIRKSEFTANLDPYLAASTLVTGLMVHSGEQIVVEDNLFYRLGTALSARNVSQIDVLNNEFRENQLDNINFGSNISDVMIRGNTLHSQLAALKPGHHYDNIQFWVQTDATQNSRNISVIENTIYDLTGAVHAQAIFARGNYVDANGIQNPYSFENFEITNNVIVTQHVNAIAVNDVQNLSVHGNTLVYAGERAGEIKNVFVPGIQHSMSSNVVIYDNVIPDRPGYALEHETVFYQNTTYDLASGQVAQLLLNPFAENPTRSNFASLSVDALRNADGSVRGALVVEAVSTGPVVQFSHSYELVGSGYRYNFDGKQSLPTAETSLMGVSFLWQFADGSQATGPVVSKVFDKAGSQTVTLTVTDARGQSSTLVKQGIVINDPVVLALDFEHGLADASSTVSLIRTTGRTVFTDLQSTATALRVGGEYGHLYLDTKDADLNQFSSTRQLTLAMRLQVDELTSSRPLQLFTQHGTWSLSVAGTGRVQLALGGEFYRFQPKVNLTDGQPHDVSMTLADNQISIFIDGEVVYQQQMSESHLEEMLNARYGLGIGGTGPWDVDARTAAYNVFIIDNVLVRTNALTSSQIRQLTTQNSLV